MSLCFNSSAGVYSKFYVHPQKKNMVYRADKELIDISIAASGQKLLLNLPKDRQIQFIYIPMFQNQMLVVVHCLANGNDCQFSSFTDIFRKEEGSIKGQVTFFPFKGKPDIKSSSITGLKLNF